MELFFNQFYQDLIATPIWQWLAVLLAYAYLLLAIKESIWCWPAAFFSTLILAVLFFDVTLYMESLLNIYYLAMAVYGFYLWKNRDNNKAKTKKIRRWRLRYHLIVILTGLVLTVISGFLLDKYTNQDLAYLDSFTTWFAVITTYMVAKKVLENWIYWIIIDAASVYLYLQKDLVLLAILMASYTIIAIFGYIQWRHSYLNQSINFSES